MSFRAIDALTVIVVAVITVYVGIVAYAFYVALTRSMGA